MKYYYVKIECRPYNKKLDKQIQIGVKVTKHSRTRICYQIKQMKKHNKKSVPEMISDLTKKQIYGIRGKNAF